MDRHPANHGTNLVLRQNFDLDVMLEALVPREHVSLFPIRLAGLAILASGLGTPNTRQCHRHNTRLRGDQNLVACAIDDVLHDALHDSRALHQREHLLGLRQR